MINVKIVCVGGLKEKYLKDAIAEYSKRLTPFCKLEIIELQEVNDSNFEKALETEADNIIKAVGKSFVVAMCIEGEQFSSEKFSDFIQKKATDGYSSIAFVIGSSHGLSNRVKNMGAKMSVSKMTFPHQLFRVMLVEQVYRAFQINAGTKYHK